MAKRSKLKPTYASLDIRQWCIEQAIRWPWDAGRGYPMQGLNQYPSPGVPPAQPDVLQRAELILKWING